MVDEKPKQGEASRFMKLGLAGALDVAMVWTGASPAVAQPEKADSPTSPAEEAPEAYPLPDIRVPDERPSGSLSALTSSTPDSREDIRTERQVFCRSLGKRMADIRSQWQELVDRVASGNNEGADYLDLVREANELRIEYTNVNAANWECLTAAARFGSPMGSL